MGGTRARGRAFAASAAALCFFGAAVAPAAQDVPLPAPIQVPAEGRPPVPTAAMAVLTQEGMTAFQRGNFEGARDAFRRVLAAEPNNLLALVNLGAAESRLGRAAEAENLLKRSLQIKVDNPTAWLNLAIVYLGRDEPVRALAAAAQAVACGPEDPVAHNYLGVAAGRCQWSDAATAELRRAIELKPDYADAHFNLAVFSLERVPPAKELARRHYLKARELGAPPDKLIEKSLAD